MARGFGPSLVFLALCGLGVISSAQPVAAPNPAPITLGDSVVPLNGPWKFTVGDSPIDPATHEYLWAESGFDDSNWETMDLTPVPGVVDP
jgi:hypothetical protein